jgi:hypothetical protein
MGKRAVCVVADGWQRDQRSLIDSQEIGGPETNALTRIKLQESIKAIYIILFAIACTPHHLLLTAETRASLFFHFTISIP